MLLTVPYHLKAVFPLNLKVTLDTVCLPYTLTPPDSHTVGLIFLSVLQEIKYLWTVFECQTKHAY